MEIEIIKNSKVMTPLESAMRKKFPEYVDFVFWMERLHTFPENEWVLPDNSTVQDYGIFDACADACLVARKVVPVWNNGSLQGTKVYFLYNNDLKF